MLYHYTYRITNIILNKHYYGASTSKNCLPIKDLGIKYFSSSLNKEFINDQKENPQNYKYKIIKISNTRKEAMELEIKLHNKFDVGINDSFYNRAKASSTGFDRSGVKTGNIHTKEFLERCHLNFGDTSGKRNSMYGTSRKGKENPFYNKKHSDETILKMSKTKNEEIVINGKTTTRAKISGEKCSITKNSKKWKNTIGEAAKIKRRNNINEMVEYEGNYITKKEMMHNKSLKKKHINSHIYDVYHIEKGYIETLDHIDLRKKYTDIDKNDKENYKGKSIHSKKLLKSRPELIGLYTILKV